jgi:YfiH family protein
MRGVSVLLKSELLSGHGFAHGFSLRSGGVGRAPFDTLNLGRTVGDDPVAVEENHRRFAAAAGFDPARLFQVSQVHGAVVHVVRAGSAPADLASAPGDALVSCVPETAVGVRVADCVPLLLADPRTGAVAAVHAGWRGTVARVLDAAIAALREEAGTSAADLLAAIGPHIRVGAFEVGADVAETIAAAAHGAPVVDRSRGEKPHVDLAATVRAQLVAAGLDAARVDDVGGCTHAEAERFFSFRRDGPRSGRHVGAIAVRSV